MEERIKILSQKLRPIFEKYQVIKLVYLFGFVARAQDGPMSDYDFAFYLDIVDKKQIFEIRLELIGQISRLLKTDKVDVVILNTAEKPELKYNIIKEGKIIFEKEPFRVIVEPRILSEYFDFKIFLSKSWRNCDV